MNFSDFFADITYTRNRMYMMLFCVWHFYLSLFMGLIFSGHSIGPYYLTNSFSLSLPPLSSRVPYCRSGESSVQTVLRNGRLH